MYCFCNKIKTFLNLLEKINTPASGSRREAVLCELSTSFWCEKDQILALRGSASQGASRASLVCFRVLPIPSRKPQDHPERKCALGCQSPFLKMEQTSWILVLDLRQSPGDAAVSWEVGLGHPPPSLPRLTTPRLFFLPLREMWQYHRPFGKPMDTPAQPGYVRISVLCFQRSITSYFPCW